MPPELVEHLTRVRTLNDPLKLRHLDAGTPDFKVPAWSLQHTRKTPIRRGPWASETEPSMRSMYKPNISATGRWVSTVAGAALAAVGFQRSNRALGLLGAGLVARGVSGWCPVTAAVERDSHWDTEPTRRHLGGSGGVIVEDAITIYRPIDDVYSYWRNLENLPRFMDHLEEVDVDRSFPFALGRQGATWCKGRMGCTGDQRHSADAAVVEVGGRFRRRSAQDPYASKRRAIMRRKSE